MTLLKLLGKLVIFACVGFAAVAVVGKVRQRSANSDAAAAAPADVTLTPAGFMMLDPSQTKNPKVVIMSPPNCPSADAKRARALGDELARSGIPHEMKSEFSLTFTSEAEADRINKFVMSANPLVIVRGRAKANPTIADIVAEYRSSAAR